jgi:hypothetical protein
MYAAKSRGIARHIIVLSLLTFLGMTAAIHRPCRKADGAAGDLFGKHVAISGDTAVG